MRNLNCIFKARMCLNNNNTALKRSIIVFLLILFTSRKKQVTHTHTHTHTHRERERVFDRKHHSKIHIIHNPVKTYFDKIKTF